MLPCCAMDEAPAYLTCLAKQASAKDFWSICKETHKFSHQKNFNCALFLFRYQFMDVYKIDS